MNHVKDITLNRRDMRNKFGYITLSKFIGEGNVLNAQRFGSVPYTVTWINNRWA